MRWFGSTNAKDIGLMYIILGIISGIIASSLSMIMRIELSNEGSVYLLGNWESYNVVITLHGLLMGAPLILFFINRNTQYIIK